MKFIPGITVQQFLNDRYNDYMSTVKVYFTDGQQRDFADNSETCIDNVDKLDDSTCLHMLCFDTYEEGMVLAPSSKIAMISMPYLGILDEEKFGKFSSDIFKVPLFGIICAIYLNFYYIYSLKKPIQLTTFIIGFFIQVLSIEIILNMIFKPKKEE